MNRFSFRDSQKRLSEPHLAALVAVLLNVSCSGPSASSDRAAVAREAIVAVGAPLLSAEFDLDHSPVLERPRFCPLVAFGTTTYLVTHSSSMYGGQLAFTRFDRAGQSLGTFDIPGASLKPSNVSNNSCAPVVFSEGVFIAYWAGDDDTLWCSRLAEDGTLLNGAGVSTGLSSSGVESVALDGDQVLASMNDGKVALAGTDCSGIAATVSLPATAGTTRWPAGATFDGTQYWVAYSETVSGAADRFFLQAVSASGTPSGSPITVATAPWVRTAASSYYLPAVQGSVAVGGGKTAVSYSVYQELFGPTSLHYAELSATGVLGNDMSLGFGFINPKIGFAGDGFALVSRARAGGILKRLNDGSTLSGYELTMRAGVSSFASDGSNLLVATAGRDNIDSSYAGLVGPDLHLLAGPTVLQHMSEGHGAPAFARGAQTSLAVWKPTYGRFSGSRLSADGTVLDPEPLEIHPQDPSYWEKLSPPAVASNGTDFLVAWSHTYGGPIYAELVSGAGDVGRSFVVTRTPTSSGTQPWVDTPIVASNGSDYLIVWGYADRTFEDPNATAHFTIEAARIKSTGQVLDNPPLVLQTFSSTNPSSILHRFDGALGVGYDGTQYVVVSNIGLSDDYAGSGGPLAETPDAPIVVQRVSGTGEIGNPIETPWRASVLARNPPVISWGDGQGLVAFAHGTKLLAGRVNSALQPLDDPPILVTDQRTFGNDTHSSAAWDGTSYWLSWKDGRRGVVEHDDIYVARVSSDGVLLDPSGIALSQGNGGNELGVSGGQLASGQGNVLAAYNRFNPAPDVFNYVLHGRWLSSGAAANGEGGQGGGADGGAGTNTGVGGYEGAQGGSGGEGLSPPSGGASHGGSTPAEGGSTPANGGSTPASGGSTPAEGGSTPANGGSTSASGGSTPAEGGSTPANGGSTPAEGGSTPANGGSTPAEGGSTPANGGSTPAEGGSTPANGGSTPATGGSTPAEGGSTPANGGSTPADGGRSGGAGSGAGTDAGSNAGGSSSPPPPHGSGCSVDATRGSPTPSLFCLATFALVLVRRRRTFTCLASQR
jgi:hypothetical protein